MQEININVRVQIGVTDQLCSLLSAFAKHVAPAAVPTPAPEPAHQEAPAPAEVEQPAPAGAPEQAAPEAAEQQQPEQVKEFTEVDVRAAMDRTRRRIEGENYKEDTTGEGYKKWHRTLTGWFKSTAAIYGADKPSALPDHESRAKFIAECDAVYVKNGELTQDLPF